MFDYSNFNESQLNQNNKNTLVEHLGIRMKGGGEGYLLAEMPVDERTVQPMNLLHGGATAALVETLGSVGSFIAAGGPCVGMEVSVNHLKAIPYGETAFAKAHLLHFGKKTHFWEVEVRNNKQQLCAKGKLSVMVLK